MPLENDAQPAPPRRFPKRAALVFAAGGLLAAAGVLFAHRMMGRGEALWTLIPDCFGLGTRP